MVHPELSQDSTSISGAWVLDLSRSDTFEGYLQFMGHSEGFIRSQVDGERAYQSRNVIALDESSLVIHKDTAVNRYTERMELDEEQLIPSRHGRGTVHATASLQGWGRLDGYVVATTITATRGTRTLAMEMMESRQVVDGGCAHLQTITVCQRSRAEQCSVRRVWDCTDPCIDKFASAAGIQNGDQCWCHQTGSTAFGRHGGGESSTGDVVCDHRCDGDLGEFCGGSWAFSLYEIQYPNVDYEVQGCFGDDPNDRIMNERVVMSDDMTNENGNECWCHETGVDYFGRHGSSGNSAVYVSCHTACAGDQEQDCGGPFAVNLMEIKY
eukprot:g4379.t1